MTITNVPSTITDPQLRVFLQQVRDNLLNGTANAATVAAVSAALSGGGVGDGGGSGDPLLSDEIPLAPTNLTATGGFQFIALNWDNQNSQPFISHVEIWRSVTDDLETAELHLVAAGPPAGDLVDYGSSYYYWARFVSYVGNISPWNATAGTLGETSQSPEQILDAIDGQIDSSHLAQSLRSEVESIAGVSAGLTQEIQDRIASDLVLFTDLGTTISTVDALSLELSDATTEITTLISDVSTINQTVSDQGDEISTIAATINTVSSDVSLNGTEISNLISTTNAINQTISDQGDEITSLTALLTTATQSIDALGVTVDANSATGTLLSSQLDDVYGDGSNVTIENFAASFQSLEAAVTDPDGTSAAAAYNKAVTLEQRVDNVTGVGTTIENIGTLAEGLQSTIEDATTGLSATYDNLVITQTTLDTVSGEVTALTTSVTELTTEVDGNIATVQTLASSIDGLEAQWEVKTQVGDLVGGVGFYNDGQQTYFMVNAGVFAVLSPDESEINPFTIIDNNVYINTALFAEATIGSAAIEELVADKITGFDVDFVLATLGEAWATNVHIGDTIQSTTWGQGATGWRISKTIGIETHEFTAYDDAGRAVVHVGPGASALAGLNTSTLAASVGDTFSNGFEEGVEFDQWVQGATIDFFERSTIDPQAGGSHLRFRSASQDADSSGTVGGIAIQIPGEFSSRWVGRRIRVSCLARKELSGSQATFELAYSTNSNGNSGWREFTLVSDTWALVHFDYDIPEGTATALSGHWLGIQGETNVLFYVDSVVITPIDVTSTSDLTDDAGLGTTADWSGVTGADRPADNADVTALANQGADWLTDQVVGEHNRVSSANVSAYFEAAAFDSIYLGGRALVFPTTFVNSAAEFVEINVWWPAFQFNYASDGSPIVLLLTLVWYNTSSSPDKMDVRINRTTGGVTTTIWDNFDFNIDASNRSTFHGVTVPDATPGVGTTTYTVEINTNDALVSAQDRACTVLKTMDI